MGAWDLYNSRIDNNGNSIRDAKIRREVRNINRKIGNSLSYHTALLDGEERKLAIIDSDNLNIKTLISLPGEDILGGEIVHWSNNYWLINDRDANSELYTKAVMEQCNYLLKWVNQFGEIVERWCIVSDGTKYLTGESVNSYAKNGMVLGDTRVSLELPRDSETLQMNRKTRLLIDDYESGDVLAYRITKPIKVGYTYNGHGAMVFVLTEVNTEDDDNLDLHIANYYKYFPRITDNKSLEFTESKNTRGKKSWL